jgi:DNA-binding CsgD family transcriptional regulator
MALRPSTPLPDLGSLAVVLVDRSHTVLFANREAASLFGLPGNGASTGPCHRLLRLRTRDGRPLCGADCRPWREAREGRPNLIPDAWPGRAPALRGLTVSTCPLGGPGNGDQLLLHVIVPAGVDRSGTGVGERPRGDTRSSPGRMERTGLVELSPREREVLKLLTSGLGTAEIARRLIISPNTVRHHVQNILATLGVHRRLDAALAWVQTPRG